MGIPLNHLHDSTLAGVGRRDSSRGGQQGHHGAITVCRAFVYTADQAGD